MRLHGTWLCLPMGLAAILSLARTVVADNITTIDIPGDQYSVATGISNSGEIVGAYVAPGVLINGFEFFQGFVYKSGRFGTLDFPGAVNSVPHGVNSSGSIVGVYSLPGDSPTGRSFYYSGGAFSSISVPGASSTGASGINDSEQIVGTYTAPFGGQGFLDNHGVFTTINFPGAATTEVFGVNDTGEIVGSYQFPSSEYGVGGKGFPIDRGFLYSGGKFTTIDVPGSGATYAYGINNSGEIVGFYDNLLGQQFGFIDTNGVFTTAVVSGSDSTALLGVNDRGDIVGSYSTGSRIYGFLAPPGSLPPPPEPTPEPSSGALLATAGCLLLYRLRMDARNP